ncbi:MAG: peroxiredoxin-like family protein [Candidatus Sumerlaeota bacterium]
MYPKGLWTALLISTVLWAACATQDNRSSFDLDTVPKSAEATTPLETGAKAPLKTLRTPQGKDFDLAAAVAEQPAVLIFYRGGWCPYCNRHLAEMQDIEPELRLLGYRVYAISPDRPAKIKESSAKNELDYTLLSDSRMEMAHAFGLAFKLDEETLQRYKGYDIDLEDATGESHHLLPVPAVYIIDTNGIIRFHYANPDYKIRLKPEKALEAAREAVKRR